MPTETCLRSVWYVAALSHELGSNLLRRVILGEPVLLFRDEATGEPAALLDRCPHRFAPLNPGRPVAGGVQCSYHGLAFGASGACIPNPHGTGRILPSAMVKTFPALERYGMLWVWLGDAEKADEVLLPDFSFLESADQRTRMAGHLATNANYQILTDNILDLSHADFLHPMLDSQGGVRTEAPKVVELPGGEMEVSWTWGPASPMGFLGHLFAPGAAVFTRLSVLWYPPATMRLTVLSAVQPEGLDNGVRADAMHIMTPETPHRTHYFFGGVRDFDPDNADFTAAFEAGVRRAFIEEDKPMIEAVQGNMLGETDIFVLRPLGLIGDAGGVRVREKLRKLISAEVHEAAGDFTAETIS